MKRHWVNLKYTLLSKRSQSKNVTYYMILTIMSFGIKQYNRHGKKMTAARASRGVKAGG